MSGTQADRLRYLAVRSNDGNLAVPALGAADTIDAQAARIEALQAERDAAVLAEREACAVVAHSVALPMNGKREKAQAGYMRDVICSAIRARSNKETK